MMKERKRMRMLNKHAYLIMAHNNFYNLEILLKMLDDERNNIFLHIDRKVKFFDRDYFQKIVKRAKLFIYQEIKVNWGGYSQVECEIFLLKQAKKEGDHLFYHLLSSADLPIQSQDDIHVFFSHHLEKQFIQFDNRRFESNKKQIYRRLKYYHPIQEVRKCTNNRLLLEMLTFVAKSIMALQMLLRVNRLKKRKIEVAFGSQWFSINQEFVDFILKNEKKVYELFHMTQTPDELFIQMLAINSKFKNDIFQSEDEVSQNLREIGWNYDLDNEHPQIFRVEDWDKLKDSKAMFARKFSDNRDREIINKIYEQYGGKRDEQNS